MTAAFAFSAALVACSSCFSSSAIWCSRSSSLFANASAASSKCAALSVLPAPSLLVGEEQRLTSRRVRLVVLGDRAVEAQLRLLLVRDHVRGLLREALVLLLRLLDRLLELHLRVGVLLVPHVQLHREVLPPTLDDLPHRDLSSSFAFPPTTSAPLWRRRTATMPSGNRARTAVCQIEHPGRRPMIPNQTSTGPRADGRRRDASSRTSIVLAAPVGVVVLHPASVAP